MAIPTFPSLPAGYTVQLGDMQALAYAANFALGKPIAKVIDNTGAHTITTAFTAIPFTTAVFDPDGMWSGGNASRLTIQTPGWYTVRYGVNCGTTGDVYTTCVASTTGANNPLGAGVVSGNYWGGTADVNAAQFTMATGGGDWPFYLYQGDYLQLFVTASTTGSATGTGVPTGSSGGGSHMSVELVSI